MGAADMQQNVRGALDLFRARGAHGGLRSQRSNHHVPRRSRSSAPGATSSIAERARQLPNVKSRGSAVDSVRTVRSHPRSAAPSADVHRRRAGLDRVGASSVPGDADDRGYAARQISVAAPLDADLRGRARRERDRDAHLSPRQQGRASSATTSRSPTRSTCSISAYIARRRDSFADPVGAARRPALGDHQHALGAAGPDGLTPHAQLARRSASATSASCATPGAGHELCRPRARRMTRPDPLLSAASRSSRSSACSRSSSCWPRSSRAARGSSRRSRAARSSRRARSPPPTRVSTTGSPTSTTSSSSAPAAPTSRPPASRSRPTSACTYDHDGPPPASIAVSALRFKAFHFDVDSTRHTRPPTARAISRWKRPGSGRRSEGAR